MPEYSALRKTPTRGLPFDLKEQESSQKHRDRRDEIARWLGEPPRRPDVDSPLFVEIVDIKQQGLLTIENPEDGSRCLPVFSSPFRAADYARTLLDSSTSVNYLSSSPRELVRMLQDLREVAVEKFVVDRCPRCNLFCAIHNVSITTAEKAIECWSIIQATELARLDLYLIHAQTSARTGELFASRDVLLETAAHVSFEDPRVHVLLGQVALALHDRELLREAKAFLQFLKLNTWERKLDEVVKSGTPNFEFED